MLKPVTFYSEGVKLAGDLFLPADIKPGERRAGIVLCHGDWRAVRFDSTVRSSLGQRCARTSSSTTDCGYRRRTRRPMTTRRASDYGCLACN